jgi:hypothetical protein
VQILPLLVQLSVLRAQGAVDQYADLPPLCDQPALSLATYSKSPPLDHMQLGAFYWWERIKSFQLLLSE